ncbi:MAG: hypothetical protein RR101_03680 [Burkholderiaceae bacterium]
MPFDFSQIHRRTPAGARETYEKSLLLSQADRLVLLLIDGRASGDSLLTRLPSVGAGRIAESIDGLLAAGLIEPIRTREPVAEGGDEAMVSRSASADAAGLKRRVNAALARAEVEAGADFNVERQHSAASTPPRALKAGRAAESTIVTQFAITSVNVPDVLDLQEERDRAEWAEALQIRRQQRLRKVMVRGGVGLLMIAALVLGLGWWRPLPQALSAQALSADLSELVGQPVSVGAIELVFSPAPRLILSNVVLGGGVHANEVTIQTSWAEFWNGLSDGHWAWGEAQVSSLTLGPQEALVVGRALLAHGDQLPVRISTIRFESVAISGSRLLPGHYEVVARRSPRRGLSRLVVRQLDAGGGRFEARVSGASSNAPVVFELEADAWMLPFGPKVRWSEVRASGTVAADAVRFSHYSLAGFYGVTTGRALASFDGAEWSLEGGAEVANLDLEALQLARRGAAFGRSAVAFQGTANADLRFAGRGATLDAAVGAAQLSGMFQVRWATLNRINLGAFAVKSAGLAGGTTRFTEFDGALRADRYGLSLRGVGGRAGAMVARGDIGIGPDDSIRGWVRVALGEVTVHAPVTLRVRGTLEEPQFAE